jgi:hypothetical protein
MHAPISMHALTVVGNISMSQGSGIGPTSNRCSCVLRVGQQLTHSRKVGILANRRGVLVNQERLRLELPLWILVRPATILMRFYVTQRVGDFLLMRTSIRAPRLFCA